MGVTTQKQGACPKASPSSQPAGRGSYFTSIIFPTASRPSAFRR